MYNICWHKNVRADFIISPILISLFYREYLALLKNKQRIKYTKTNTVNIKVITIKATIIAGKIKIKSGKPKKKNNAATIAPTIKLIKNSIGQR